MGIADGRVLADGREIYAPPTSRWACSLPPRTSDARRVVVTGQGIVSSLGNNLAEVDDQPARGPLGHPLQPGLRRARHALPGQRPAGADLEAAVDRRTLRFMGDAAAYAWLAMQQAIAQSGLTAGEVSHPRTGLVAGSRRRVQPQPGLGRRHLRAKGIKRVGPFMVTRTMGSTVSACLATPSRSRASTTRSPRPAPPARIASATPRN
jgi:3-oxoacyl-[acyl-carrier-protein] synthase-1